MSWILKSNRSLINTDDHNSYGGIRCNKLFLFSSNLNRISRAFLSLWNLIHLVSHACIVIAPYVELLRKKLAEPKEPFLSGAASIPKARVFVTNNFLLQRSASPYVLTSNIVGNYMNKRLWILMHFNGRLVYDFQHCSGLWYHTRILTTVKPPL